MHEMKIVVIGLGSMGKRRIRLIKEMYPDYTIVGIDGREDRRKEACSQFGIKCTDSINGVDSANCAFICTSPLSHNSLIHECLLKGWNVFTELNLVSDGYQENISLAKTMGRTLFLSSTFFYREEIRYIRSKISVDKKWNYSYHIGQYLPDWHPWENYKDFFLGDKRTNGCREIMAIELPWLTATFGEVEIVNVLSDKLTALNIDYMDNFIIQLQHKNGNKGALIVDVVSPVAVRKLEVYSEGAYISWNGTPDSVAEFDARSKKLVPVTLSEQTEHVDGYSAFVVENAYKNEIREFFNVVNGISKAQYGFDQDLKVLQLIDMIGA
jgi:predicted dehydrogenase